MNIFLFCRRLFFVGAIFILCSAAHGYSAGDYYQAGLQLYNAKNFTQAAQYFTAALSLEPASSEALQGRGNCHYALGQYREALNDYEKVQSLAPSDQLSQFIQSLRAKTGTAAPAVGSALPSATALGEDFNQGAALYQQRQYAAAVPYFQKAAQENPNDANAYYYLGASFLGLGDMKNAALNLSLSNRKQSNPSVEAYVNQLKARMTPEDMQWVEGQVMASATAGAARVTGPQANKSLGIRLEPGITLLDLADFTANAEGHKAVAGYYQTSYPTLTFDGVVPTGCLNIRLEPVLKLSPNLELGLPIGIMPVGTVSNNAKDSYGDYITDSYAISAFTAGLNVRYLIGTGEFQPFIGGGLLVAPMNIDCSASMNLPTYSSYTYTVKGNFTSMGLGGQIQLGLDWHLGDSFVVSPFAGYQMASAGDFTATVNGASGTVQLEVVPIADGKIITPVSDGKLVLPIADSKGVYLPGDNVPAGSKPLTVDLGGLTAGIQISMFF